MIRSQPNCFEVVVVVIIVVVVVIDIVVLVVLVAVVGCAIPISCQKQLS